MKWWVGIDKRARILRDSMILAIPQCGRKPMETKPIVLNFVGRCPGSVPRREID